MPDTTRLSSKIPTEAKCPRCRKIHKVRLRWIGRGIPRVYCAPCRNIVSYIGDIAIHKRPVKPKGGDK